MIFLLLSVALFAIVQARIPGSFCKGQLETFEETFDQPTISNRWFTTEPGYFWGSPAGFYNHRDNYQTQMPIPNSGLLGLRLKIDTKPCLNLDQNGQTICQNTAKTQSSRWSGAYMYLRNCSTYGVYEFDVAVDSKNAYFVVGFINRNLAQPDPKNWQEYDVEWIYSKSYSQTAFQPKMWIGDRLDYTGVSQMSDNCVAKKFYSAKNPSKGPFWFDNKQIKRYSIVWTPTSWVLKIDGVVYQTMEPNFVPNTSLNMVIVGRPFSAETENIEHYLYIQRISFKKYQSPSN